MSTYSTEHTYKEAVLFSRDTPSEKHSSALPHTTRGLPDPEYGRVLRPRGGFATRTRFTHDKDSIAHRKVRAGFDGGVRTGKPLAHHAHCARCAAGLKLGVEI